MKNNINFKKKIFSVDPLTSQVRRWREQIEKIMERDTFMSPDEAKEMGLIDEVVSKRPTPEKD